MIIEDLQGQVAQGPGSLSNNQSVQNNLKTNLTPRGAGLFGYTRWMDQLLAYPTNNPWGPELDPPRGMEVSACAGDYHCLRWPTGRANWGFQIRIAKSAYPGLVRFWK